MNHFIFFAFLPSSPFVLSARRIKVAAMKSEQLTADKMKNKRNVLNGSIQGGEFLNNNNNNDDNYFNNTDKK